MKTYNDYKNDEVKSAVYNALAQVSMEHDASQEEMQAAIDWFVVHFYEDPDAI